MRALSTERLRVRQAGSTAQGRTGAAGPGPSRWAYRLARLWKKTWVRQAVLGGVPLAVLVALGVRLAADPEVHAWVAAQKDAVIARLSERPEFSIQAVHVTGASPDLTREVAEVAAVSPGTSSLRLNLGELQPRIEALGPVKAAHVTLGSDGVLKIHVTERIPAALWRDGEDRLWLIDREGALIARAVTRLGYPDLPIVLGQGAPVAVAEALEVLATGAEIRGRVRALVRVGARRWDMVLDRDLRIMLPEDAPADALARVMGWRYDSVMDRGLAVIDMRLGERPTLRMNAEAAEAHRLRNAARADGEDT